MDPYKRQGILNKTGKDPLSKKEPVKEWGLWNIGEKKWVDGVHGSYRFCAGMKKKMEDESEFVRLKIIPWK